MPFTLSHPAAISLLWPLVRPAQLPLAALAIGAMSPDFEFFLHLRPMTLWSRTAAGLFGFCLPVGLAVFATWEFVARDAVRDLLAFAPQASSSPITLSWWGRAAVGVLIGAGTHLLWDGVTHGDYWGAHVWPGLRSKAVTVGAMLGGALAVLFVAVRASTGKVRRG